MIKNAAKNMNKIVFAKYGIAPENIEEKSLDPKDAKKFSRSLQSYKTKKKSK